MSEETLKSNETSRGIWQWLQDQFIQTVPDDCAVCEYNCRKCQCTSGEWESCARRLNKPAGETIPRQENNCA